MSQLEDERAEGAASATVTPVKAAEVQDSFSQVLATMSSLPPKQQEALRLKFQHGLSYKEISRVTEDSIGNVGWLIHAGLKSLREKLATSEIRGAQA